MDPIEYWGAAPLTPPPHPRGGGLLCSHAPCTGGRLNSVEYWGAAPLSSTTSRGRGYCVATPSAWGGLESNSILGCGPFKPPRRGRGYCVATPPATLLPLRVLIRRRVISVISAGPQIGAFWPQTGAFLTPKMWGFDPKIGDFTPKWGDLAPKNDRIEPQMEEMDPKLGIFAPNRGIPP